MEDNNKILNNEELDDIGELEEYVKPDDLCEACNSVLLNDVFCINDNCPQCAKCPQCKLILCEIYCDKCKKRSCGFQKGWLNFECHTDDYRFCPACASQVDREYYAHMKVKKEEFLAENNDICTQLYFDHMNRSKQKYFEQYVKEKEKNWFD